MKYALLIYPKPGSHEALTEEEYAPVNAEYFALGEDPRCLGGAHLQPRETATTVRYGGGETLITDGPYADTKEVLGGYYVLDAADLDAALEFAQRPRRRPRRRLRRRPSGGLARGRRGTRWPGWWPPGATARSTGCVASARCRT